MRTAARCQFGTRVMICLVGSLAMLAALLGAAPGAWAQDGGTAGLAVPQFPSVVTVGEAGIPASLSVGNASYGSYASDSFTVEQITLTPSCGSNFPFGPCPAASEDPGVFVPSAVGTGRVGTACAGTSFAITLIDPGTGGYALTPDIPVVVGPTGSSSARCIIDFTVDVNRLPSLDSSPSQPGVQTDQRASVVLTDVTPGDRFGQLASATGTARTTVLQANPTIATTVSDGAITLGDSFTDTATVSGGAGGPAPTGAVNFSVYGPNDPTCTGAPVATSLRPLSADGTATSGAFAPPAPGVYRVIAVYTGDSNYTPVSGVCNEPNETTVVSAVPPPPPPPPSLPTDKEQCKKGGWMAFGIFKNQGDCVSFVATGGRNPPAGPR